MKTLDPSTLEAQLVLVKVLSAENRFVESEKIARVATEKISRVFGPQHPMALDIELALAGNLLLQRQFSEAEFLGRKIISLAEKYSRSNGLFISSMTLVARIHLAQGRIDEGRLMFEKAKEESLTNWGEEHPITKAIMVNIHVTNVP